MKQGLERMIEAHAHPFSKPVSKTNGLTLLWISLLVFAFDWFSKTQVLSHLDPYQPYAIFPGFNLTLAFNNGVAFSLFDHQSIWPNIIFGFITILVSLFILIWLYREKDFTIRIALALILGGALGNLWDRVSYAHVVDFLDFYVYHLHWPVFNLADSAICVGSFLILVRWLILQRSEEV